MAFSTTNVKTASVGDFFAQVGQFTSNKGDANGSLTIGGAIVYHVYAFDSSATTPTVQPLPFSITASGNNSIISLNVSEGVTAGRYYIVYR